ncbi:hypothetical protein IGB42_02418 [Andreprevotia sp. IGB-42]|uniref:hypothetical protein n=1 Tax=Andreprevotia sp. IGB-42 TaxID=2497473 RepID=UPI00135A12A6|nr:hypothetical protein [Andreprevotia sp. IGB-42]KAF0813022.1 hypothetical protein IGB42_02418 [Andreprevotia sp. IGB-42]
MKHLLHVLRTSSMAGCLAAAVLLAACGGGGGGGATPTPAPTPTPRPTPAPTPVPQPPGPISGVYINEVASNYWASSPAWFEVLNKSGGSINLASYSVRTQAADPYTGTTFGVQNFNLPAVIVPNGGYVVVAGKTRNGLLNNAAAVYVADGNGNVPFWDANGAIELLTGGQSVDFVRFGNDSTQPTAAAAWNGANAPSPSFAASAPAPDAVYNASLVRLASAFTQTHSAADWVRVNFSTPAGPNDVAPGITDSDNDGIPDSAKVAGGRFGGLDLYSMGARPGHKDMFVQIDYLDSPDRGVIPQKTALDKIVAAFQTHNIYVHFDAGNLFGSSISTASYNLVGNQSYRRTFARCVQLDINPGSLQSGCTSAYDIKTANMDVRRKSFFRYLLFAYSQSPTGAATGSGMAELAADDAIITLGNWGLDTTTTSRSNMLTNFQASTVMHELGHLLGLLHGGDEDESAGANYKPNYLSVMNYLYQLGGLPDPKSSAVTQRYYFSQNQDYGKTVPGYAPYTYDMCTMTDGPCSSTFKIDFSDGSGAVLDKNKLVETALIGRGAYAGSFGDWNLNGTQQASSYAYDLNNAVSQTGNPGNNLLHDYNDWGNLVIATKRMLYANNTGQALHQSGSIDAVPVRRPLFDDRSTSVAEPAPSASLQSAIRGAN